LPERPAGCFAQKGPVPFLRNDIHRWTKMMIPETGTLLIWLGGAGLLLMAAVALLGTGRKQVADRLATVSGDSVVGGIPSGRAAGLLNAEGPLDRITRRRLKQEEKKRRMRERMMQAGFYAAVSGSLFMLLRILLVTCGAGLGFLVAAMSNLPPIHGLGIGALSGAAATVAPSFWLDHLKKVRQVKLRRALPDALDVMVVCLQGGLSVMASMSRVANELVTAHPMLAMEFKIAERQMQMGQSAGEALRGVADRFDMEELRGMAAVIKQAERIGASIAAAMEVFADSLRLKRTQRAEELAHKAAVKILIPTVLCIFPAIFIVILGPAAIQIYNQLIVKGP
jgi:tight adherence protein C